MFKKLLKYLRRNLCLHNYIAYEVDTQDKGTNNLVKRSTCKSIICTNCGTMVEWTD